MSGSGFGLYEDPVLYDILHEPGTESEVKMLLRVWRHAGAGSPRVALEPACGTGRYLTRLARSGWKVRGFDSDSDMVKYAKSRFRGNVGADSRIWKDRFDAFGPRVAPSSVGLAFCPINSIRHVASDAELVRHLVMMKRVLAPSGLYAVGISLSAYGLEAPTEDVWKGRRGPVSVKQVVNYTPACGGEGRIARAERVDTVLEIRRGGTTEIRVSSYSLLSYSRVQWEVAVARSGLRVIGMVNEFASKFDPGHIGYAIWLLARPDHPLALTRRVRGSRRTG